MTSSIQNPAPPSAGSRWLCYLGEAILYLIIILSVWLFGSTDQWAKYWMAGVAGFLALVCLVSHLLEPLPPQPSARRTRALAWLNLVWLAYIAMMIVNPRAVYHPVRVEFSYFECFSWLPTTYDRGGTIRFFLDQLTLTAVFWSLRHLLNCDHRRRALSGQSSHGLVHRLILVLLINGAAVATLGLLQRASGTSKIFWSYETRWGHAKSIFGPFPYRGNAADYFNLLWPLGLGFSYVLWKFRQSHRDMKFSLALVCAALCCVAPIASTSRGGTIVTALLLGIAGFYSLRRFARRTLLFVVLAFIIGVSVFVSGPEILYRFSQADLSMSGRDAIFKNSWVIFRDFPWFGVGLGSFGPVYGIYRQPGQRWESYAHNDWLEALVTTGVVGGAIQFSLLALVCSLAYAHRHERGTFTLRASIALALFGCAVHALSDFPFRILSIQILFTILCSLFTVPLGASQLSPARPRSPTATHAWASQPLVPPQLQRRKDGGEGSDQKPSSLM